MKALMPSMKQQSLHGALLELGKSSTQDHTPVTTLTALPLRLHVPDGGPTPAHLTSQVLEGGSSKLLC